MTLGEKREIVRRDRLGETFPISAWIETGGIDNLSLRGEFP
jgi:hypothetical protein